MAPTPPSSSPSELLPLTPVTFHILVALAHGPAHGYGLKRSVEERSDGRVRLGAGTLYTGLQRMERDGLVRETEAPADMEAEASSRWRFYALTPLGRRTLAAELERLEQDLREGRAALSAAGEA